MTPTERLAAHPALAEATILSLQARLEWLPIETAPKDGRCILLYTGDGIVECAWSFGFWEPQPSCLAAHDGIGTVLSDSLTHWMPLPPPPRPGLASA